MTKSILNADINHVREKSLFQAVLKQVKRPKSVFEQETCFKGYGTNWKGSLEK